MSHPAHLQETGSDTDETGSDQIIRVGKRNRETSTDEETRIVKRERIGKIRLTNPVLQIMRTKSSQTECFARVSATKKNMRTH